MIEITLRGRWFESGGSWWTVGREISGLRDRVILVRRKCRAKCQLRMAGFGGDTFRLLIFMANLLSLSLMRSS